MAKKTAQRKDSYDAEMTLRLTALQYADVHNEWMGDKIGGAYNDKMAEKSMRAVAALIKAAIAYTRAVE